MITDKSPFFESLNQCYVIHRVRGCVIHRVRGCVIHRVRGCVRGLCQSLFSNHLNRGCVQGLYKNQCVCTSTCRSLLSKPLVQGLCPPVFLIGYCFPSLRDSSFCFFTTFIQAPLFLLNKCFLIFC